MKTSKINWSFSSKELTSAFRATRINESCELAQKERNRDLLRAIKRTKAMLNRVKRATKTRKNFTTRNAASLVEKHSAEWQKTLFTFFAIVVSM